MANERVIKVDFPESGRADVTAAIYKPDDTIRDGQSAVVLDDTGHLSIYVNLVAITIEVGDTIQPLLSGVSIGASQEYQPELAATGFTVGGTMSVKDLYKVIAGWVAGTLRLKTGETNLYETLDADDDSTPVMETTLETEPEDKIYKEVDIL